MTRGREPALTDAQALELARIALLLEEHFQAPQDIEWCLDRDGRILYPAEPASEADGRRQPGSGAVLRPWVTRSCSGAGRLASPGVAAGPVYLVRNNLDLLQFPEGAVLVTAFPHPTWATLLSRAAAVVTDRGGITGHLANVAREFGIPALFNTGQATQRSPPGKSSPWTPTAAASIRAGWRNCCSWPPPDKEPHGAHPGGRRPSKRS